MESVRHGSLYLDVRKILIVLGAASSFAALEGRVLKPAIASDLPEALKSSPELPARDRTLLHSPAEISPVVTLEPPHLETEALESDRTLPRFQPEPYPALAQDLPNSETEAPASDPELGTLRLEEVPKPDAAADQNFYLFGWTGYARSSNIFAGIDPVDDGMFRAGLTFLALEQITPTTTIFGTVGGSTLRYQEQTQYDYARLNFNVGVSQILFDRTEAEIGWENQRLFGRDGNGRFLNDHAAYLQLRRRDPLAERVYLDTSYLLRFSFTDPESRSQTLHGARVAFNYFPYRALQLGLEYQFVFSDFTKLERRDRYHELIARLNYQLSPRSRLELFGGRSFGGSSDPNIDFNNYIFGIGLGFTLF